MSKFKLAKDDAYEGRCAEIFITEKHYLVFHCSLCDQKYVAFNGLLEHITDQHYAEVTQVPEALMDEVDDYIQSFFTEEDGVVTEKDVCMEAASNTRPQLWKESPPAKVEPKQSEPSDYEAKSVEVVEEEETAFEVVPVDSNLHNFLSREVELQQSDNSKLPPYLGRCRNNDDAKRKYRCDVCGAGFKEPCKLRYHALRHTGQKDFNCTQCPKKFYSRGELDIHERRHNNERPYICEECGHSFVSASVLCDHMKRHEDNRPHQCEYCAKRFFKYYELKKHLQVHMKERFLASDNPDENGKRRKRRLWVRPIFQERETSGFFETTFQIMRTQDNALFGEETRMSVEHFDDLIGLLRNRLKKNSPRKPISPECRLALTLIYLAHGGPRSDYVTKFKMSSAAVARIIAETCEAIWDVLSEIYLPAPDNSEWLSIAASFSNKWRLPHCLGAVDGRKVSVVCPSKVGMQNSLYKRKDPIVIVASCDANYCFTLVDIGAFNNTIDEGPLAEIEFGKLFSQDQLPIPSPSFLPNSSEVFPYFFVGNTSFPLRKNLMRPFPETNLTEESQLFNKRLNHARLTIENTFGVLSTRWRVLRDHVHAAHNIVDKVIKATIVLHNYLMHHKCIYYCPPNYVDNVVGDEVIPGEWRNDTSSSLFTPIPSSRARNATKESLKLRQILSHYLQQQDIE